MNMILLCILTGNLHRVKCNDIDDEVQLIPNWKDKYNNHFKEITCIFQIIRNQYLCYDF